MAFQTGALLARMTNLVKGFVTQELSLIAGDISQVFWVENGPILLHFYALQITEAVSANASLIHLEAVPTLGSATDISEGTAAPDIQSAAIGDWFAMNGDSQDVMKKHATGTDLPMIENHNGGIIVPPGDVTLKLSTSDPTTGKGKLYVLYTPFTADVFVGYSGVQ